MPDLSEIVEESDDFDRMSSETKGKGRAVEVASRSPSRSHSPSRVAPPTNRHSHRRTPSPEPPTPVTEVTSDTLDTLESLTMTPASDMPYGIELAVSRSVTPTPISPERPLPPLMPRLSSEDRIEQASAIDNRSPTPPAHIVPPRIGTPPTERVERPHTIPRQSTPPTLSVSVSAATADTYYHSSTRHPGLSAPLHFPPALT